MKKLLFSIAMMIVFGFSSSPALAEKPTITGFDQFGYNRTARIFNGTGSTWCREQGKSESCLGEYSPDKLIMKWNAEWDRGNDEDWANPPYYAWENNEWNGMKDGSGEVWHYKIVWVGPCGADSTLLEDGGYCLWGQFEVLSDHGKDSDGHLWLTHAIPNGYGAYRWNQVDTFTVPADSVNGVMSNITLNADSKYLLKVTGTANAGDGIEFDADYSIRTQSNIDWTDSVSTYESYGNTLLDLKVNDSFVNWGPYNVLHKYFYYMTGNDAQVNLKVNDIYPSNNTGFLTVSIFERN